MIRPLVSLLDRSIGRCSTCASKAFLAAVAAWGIAFGVTAFGDVSWLSPSVTGAAICLSLLWLAHLGVFALRITMATQRSSTLDPSPGASEQTIPAAPNSRRHFVSQFARTAVVVAVATAFSARAYTALAATNCDCSKCRSDQSCCPTANGQCGCFPFRCP